MFRRKGISPLLSGVMYLAIVTVSLGVVMQIGMPAIEKMEDNSAIEQAKNTLIAIDKVIMEIAEQGKGSTRVLPIQIKKGKLYIDNESDRIYYVIETESEIISPRTKTQIGNLYISSNANVDVTDNTTHFIMENEHEKIVFEKLGNITSFVSINASQLMKSMYLKDTGTYLDANLTIRVDDDPNKESGNGYTIAEKTGTGLMRGRIIAHINQSESDYDIYFTLEGGEDFMQIEVMNYNEHI